MTKNRRWSQLVCSPPYRSASQTSWFFCTLSPQVCFCKLKLYHLLMPSVGGSNAAFPHCVSACIVRDRIMLPLGWPIHLYFEAKQLGAKVFLLLTQYSTKYFLSFGCQELMTHLPYVPTKHLFWQMLIKIKCLSGNWSQVVFTLASKQTGATA